MQLGESARRACSPPAEAQGGAARNSASIGVRVIRVGTLFDQMIFDKERLVVQAGKPVEFVFENTDIMPHNFVIVTPGNLEKIGQRGRGVRDPARRALRAQYVPTMPPRSCSLRASCCSRGRSQQLKLHRAEEAGDLPVRLHLPRPLAADVRRALRRRRPRSLSGRTRRRTWPRTRCRSKDDLLKFNRPRTEWKLDELAGAVEGDGSEGRPELRQRQADVHGGDVHRVPQVRRAGQRVRPGPRRSSTPKMFKNAVDVPEHILDPSKKIDDKYAMYRIVLDQSSKVITGDDRGGEGRRGEGDREPAGAAPSRSS